MVQKYSYKNITFCCDICGYKIKGIKNIHSHMDECTEDDPSYDLYTDDVGIQTMDICLSPNPEHIPVLSPQLPSQKIPPPQIPQIPPPQIPTDITTIEHRIKSYIWMELLKANTTIKIPQSLEHPSNDCGIVCVNQEIDIINKNSSTKQQQRFKPPKSEQVEQIIPSTTMTDEKITACSKNSTQDIHKFDSDLENELSYYKIMDDEIYNSILQKVRDSKQISKPLRELASVRSRSLPLMSIDSYVKMVINQTNTIEQILKEKGTKKIDSYIAQSLTGLEVRLAGLWHYGKFAEFDSDMLSDLQLALRIINPRHLRQYEIFDISKIQNRLINYGLALLPLEDMIRMAIINPYGYNTIIYVDLKKSKPEDKYSFYTLQKVVDNRQHGWKMDCRLEETSMAIGSQLKKYMVELFRKMYFGIFQDNDYRPDYSKKCQITECDLSQLLRNIVACSKDLEFIKLVQSIIVENSTYVPLESVDKFNLFGDDFQQRSRFSQYEEKDPIEVLSGLFDNIVMEQLVDLYRKFS